MSKNRIKERRIGSCQICGKGFFEKDLGDGVWFNYDGDMYNYRGFDSCGDCFDELIVKVDEKRQRIIDEQNSRQGNFIPPYYPSGVENPFATLHNNMPEIKRINEIASKPNWEEENEYRQGILFTHRKSTKEKDSE